ncbi:MAG TPA: tetratricopeptide repeat protein [Polyangiaceae bacterium]
MSRATAALGTGARRSRRGAAVIAMTVTVVVGLLPVVSARAAPPADASSAAKDRDQALALYRASTKAYEEGRFQDAVDLLTQAYGLEQEPVILFNLARAYEGLGDLEKAVDAYVRYLDRQPDASDRGSIEQRVATLNKQIADRKTLEQQRDEERARAEQARKAAEDTQERVAREEQQRQGPGAWPWIIGGTGVAALGAGIVLGAVSHGKYEDAVGDAYRGPAESDYRTAQSFATGANVAFVAGGVLTAASVVWLVVERLSRHEAAPASPAVVVGAFPGEFVGRF